MTTASTLFHDGTVITMEPGSPPASAVLVNGDRIVAVGELDELRQRDCVIDETFADAVVCAGFIDRHLHPVLGATTLITDVIATPRTTSGTGWQRPNAAKPTASGCSPGVTTSCGTAS